MSAITPARRPRHEDPRITRTRAALLEAARTLFLRQGYAGTTVEEIATLAGIAKRTVYNRHADKAALFTEIVSDAIAFAEAFAAELPGTFSADVRRRDLAKVLHDLGQRLARGILRPEIVALRRLLVGEARAFPELALEYFERAPGRVIEALAGRFEEMDRRGLLRVPDARRAAEQFAYLVAGAPLDRAVLTGTLATPEEIAANAREGVETFLARYGC